MKRISPFLKHPIQIHGCGIMKNNSIRDYFLFMAKKCGCSSFYVHVKLIKLINLLSGYFVSAKQSSFIVPSVANTWCNVLTWCYFLNGVIRKVHLVQTCNIKLTFTSDVEHNSIQAFVWHSVYLLVTPLKVGEARFSLSNDYTLRL